jgi:hypothetical protein
LNGRTDLPCDPLALLFAREKISAASYAAGRRFASLTVFSRRAMNLQEASVADFWRRLVAGTPGDIGTPPPVGADDDTPTTADHLRRRLERMREELWRPGEQGELYFAVMAICVDAAWPAWLKRVVLGHPGYPGDHRRFGLVKEGLYRLVELARRREEAPAVRAEAAE